MSDDVQVANRRGAGIPRAKIDTLTAWWETELHSEGRARGAPLHRGALTRAADTDRDAASSASTTRAEHFSPEEMLEIVGVVVNTNVWTRIKLAEGAMPRPAATRDSHGRDR